MSVEIIQGDALEVLRTMDAESVHSVVTDPPYGLGFMGKDWDCGVPGVHFWQEMLRVAKPGTHLLAFGGTRTFHRMACAIEDAGWEIRDCIMWVYGSGFPKSLDVSKAIDKAAGAEREVIRERYTVKRLKPGATVVADGAWGKQDVQYTATDTTPATDDAKRWNGWGTALKPAWEPIIVARKPLCGSVAKNVLTHGVGGINVDGCRVDYVSSQDMDRARVPQPVFDSESPGDVYNFKSGTGRNGDLFDPSRGRWPANVIHDGSMDVIAITEKGANEILGKNKARGLIPTRLYVYPEMGTETLHHITLGDKSTQHNDIQHCKKYVESLNSKRAKPADSS